MVFLGIDPGIEITGFAFVRIENGKRQLLQCGVIRTPSSETLEARLQMIHEDLNSLLQQADDVTACGVEELFFSKNVTTAAAVWQARGVILLTLQQHGIPTDSIKPNQVKSAIVGTAAADKKEMQKMIQLMFDLDSPPKPDDAADAVAIAVTAASKYA